LFASTDDPRTLLAQAEIDATALTVEPTQARVCSLDALGIDSDELYENTKKRERTSAAGEDVGRYI
jgi:hypothetical protein